MPAPKATREDQIEQYLVRQFKARMGENARASKFTSPSRRSVPDRLLLWPPGMHCFVELKRPGQQPTALQGVEIRRMWDMGQPCTWVDTKDKVDALIDALQAGETIDEEFTEMLHLL